MDASIRCDLVRQRIGINTLQLVQLTVLHYQARQLECLCKFFQNRTARGNAAGGRFSSRVNIQLFENFADLLWRVYFEFATSDLVDLERQPLKLDAKIMGKVGKDPGVDAESDLFHPIENRDQRKLDFRV